MSDQFKHITGREGKNLNGEHKKQESKMDTLFLSSALSPAHSVYFAGSEVHTITGHILDSRMFRF